MATLPTLPPLDGSLYLLPDLVDFNAEHNPDRPWAVFPKPDGSSEIASVTFSEFAKASHRVAHTARPLGAEHEGRDGEVVALVLQTDSILYIALLAGLIRAGLVVRHIATSLAPLISTTLSTNSRSQYPRETLLLR